MAIAFYYGLTGLACFWYYIPLVRRGRRDGNTVWLKCILPLLGALILFAFFFYACHIYWSPSYGYIQWQMPFPPHWDIGGVFLTGIGALVIGIPLMYMQRFANPSFFRGETIPKTKAGETVEPAPGTVWD